MWREYDVTTKPQVLVPADPTRPRLLIELRGGGPVSVWCGDEDTEHVEPSIRIRLECGCA